MEQNGKIMKKILIVDDSDINREILADMIEDRYEILEAENGEQALEVLREHYNDIILVLLDLNMPVMNGYSVLEYMNSRHWLDDIPVIIISEESRPDNVQHAYDLGVTDFISRPFDRTIVLRRITNTVALYVKQKRLADLVVSQIYEKEKNSNLMISILSHIVEFRNGESGLHVLHVQNLTETLLRALMRITNKYRLTASDITLISHASALHDIGKISIPSEILNKPGRLTNEEFAIMKTHSMAGAQMLSALSAYVDEPLVKTAYEICRWHHERFDGRGYPDGLVGDDIPISAQIVALADVYDALTSERVYKAAFTHEKAVDMIVNGECGSFNPLLIDCLKAAEKEVQAVKSGSPEVRVCQNIDEVADELLQHAELSSAKNTINMLHHERNVHTFLRAVSDDLLLEYTATPAVLTVPPFTAKVLGISEVTVNPVSEQGFDRFIRREDLCKLREAILRTKPTDPDFTFYCDICINGTFRPAKLQGCSTWSIDEPPIYTGMLAKITELQDIQA